MAVFLPDLSCELALRQNESRLVPLATIATRPDDVEGAPTHRDLLSSSNDAARRLGIRPGQTVAEARAIAAHLVVRSVTSEHLTAELGRIAEVGLALGTTVSVDSGDGTSSLDTVWIDLTGAAHLHAGEEGVLIEMGARIADFGHRARVAIADGPRLAKAAAVFADSRETIVAPGGGRGLMAPLPLDALPLSREQVVWLNRLGLWKVEEITALPTEAVGSRLGQRWRDALDLALGCDDAPLVPYELPRTPTESAEWDDGVTSMEPLLFTLRALTSRLSARLRGRGEAAQSLELWAPYDVSIAALRGVARGGEDHPLRAGLCFRIDLPSPLAGAEDLFRVFKSKLEHARIEAPARALSIQARTLTAATAVQLSLRGEETIDADPRALAILLAELSADIGAHQLGVLEIAPVHRPEGRTKLAPILSFAEPRAAWTLEPSDEQFPTRLLKTALALPFVPTRGATLAIDHHLFTVTRVRHAMRIDQVEWWKPDPVCRDYMRVWLTSGRKNVDAWVYTDRTTGRAYLHGFFD
jgi:protein ImuB